MLRGAAVCLSLILLGCRTLGSAGEPELTVDSLEVSFGSASRGQLDFGLTVRGGGVALRTQWQVLIDGQPLGSGVYAVSQRLDERGPSAVKVSAPLLTVHSARDDGWRTVTLELSGELTVQRRLEERLQFATRRQVLIRGAPKF